MRYLPVIAVTLALVSCSNSGDDESSLCANREAVQSSFQDLRDVSVAEDGIEALDAAIDAVLADLTTLRASATEFRPEVDAVQSALQDTRSAVAAATTPAAKATAAVDGLSSVSVAWQTLDEAGSECD